jgi:hypothetical protein
MLLRASRNLQCKDEVMEQKMKTFLAVKEAVEVPIAHVLKAGKPRAPIISTAEKRGSESH